MEISTSSYSVAKDLVAKFGNAVVLYILSGGNVYRFGLPAAKIIITHSTSTFTSEATFLSDFPDAIAVTQVSL
jgi:hypothetical protein